MSAATPQKCLGGERPDADGEARQHRMPEMQARRPAGETQETDMKRCPKHPDRDALGTSCEVWISKTKMCGHAFESVPQEEIRAMQVADLKEALEKTDLPDWVVDGIRQWAWDIGHSCGQAEVDGYMQEWLYGFEELRRNAAVAAAKR